MNLEKASKNKKILNKKGNSSGYTLLFTPTPVQTPYVWAESQLFRRKGSKTPGDCR